MEVYHLILLSVLPLYESRYTIPLLVKEGLSIYYVFILAVINSLVFIPTYLFVSKFSQHVLRYKRLHNLWNLYLTKLNKKKRVIDKYGYLGLFLLVFLPLPGSGVYTASLVSALLELNKMKSFMITMFAVLLIDILLYYSILGVVKLTL